MGEVGLARLGAVANANIYCDHGAHLASFDLRPIVRRRKSRHTNSKINFDTDGTSAAILASFLRIIYVEFDRCLLKSQRLSRSVFQPLCCFLVNIKRASRRSFSISLPCDPNLVDFPLFNHHENAMAVSHRSRLRENTNRLLFPPL